MTTGITADKPCLPPYAPEQAGKDLTTSLLRDVSRSFYLTLRVLPEQIRQQISVAYLLARTTDTIADTEAVPKSERVALLNGLAAGRSPGRIGVTNATLGEVKLLDRLPEVLKRLESFLPEDRQRIWELLRTIVSGQIFDLERFPGDPLTDDELDRYTYMVAGCVGEFWTKMCRAHLPDMEGLNVEDSVHFGKGLQLVNILRDMEEDRRRERQYLPRLDDFPVWLDRATQHLDAGWRYTLAIPANQKRLRLACVWPIWIGIKTIARLRQAGPGQPVKVSRSEVYWIMLESALIVGNDAALDEVYQRLSRAARL